MQAITVRGESPNISLLARHLSEAYGDAVDLQISEVPPAAEDELRHADIADLVISFALSVVSSAVYDGIRVLIKRAGTRGDIDTTGLDGDATDEEL